MVKILLFICALICFVQSEETDGLLLETEGSEGNPKQDQETCSIGNVDLIGLLPGFEDCGVFWLCRKSASPNKTVEVEQFRCDVDETKPYYDATKCECVSTKDHCERNNDEPNRISCVRVLEEEQAVEDCQGFGPSGDFYENHFVNFDNPQKFWFCHPNEVCADSKDAITTAAEFDCPSGLQYNMQSCKCDYRFNVSVTFNQHPMNRFKCAVPFVVTKDRETCQDEQKRYYEGLFVYAEDPQLFWECSVTNDSTTSASLMSVSQAELQRCESSDTYFNIETCDCDFERPENNSNAEYRYNCATLLDVEEETDPCRDSNGLYHIGNIPDITDCSKFLSCVTTLDPVVTAPIQQHCHNGLFFNVLSSFDGHCGCDRPENFKCEDNHIPENKFLCARETTTSGSIFGSIFSQF